MQTKGFAFGVCNDDMGHNYASTSGNFRTISLCSLSFVGGLGEKGGSDPKCNKMSTLKDLTVAAKRFKLIIMF